MQTKRSLVEATAKYLFTCPAHAWILHTDNLVVLPVYLLDPPEPAPRNEEEDGTKSQAALSVVSGKKTGEGRGTGTIARLSLSGDRRGGAPNTGARRRLIRSC